MLLQTNSYIVPRDKREEHARLVRKFRQVLLRLGCESFDVYEQVGTNWGPGEATGRYVQIMRFVDRRSQQAVQAAEKSDKGAQHVIAEFCELINFPYQQQQGLFASGFYQSVLPTGAARPGAVERNKPRNPGTPPPAGGKPEPLVTPPPSTSESPVVQVDSELDSSDEPVEGEISPFDNIQSDEPEIVEGEETYDSADHEKSGS